MNRLPLFLTLLLFRGAFALPTHTVYSPWTHEYRAINFQGTLPAVSSDGSVAAVTFEDGDIVAHFTRNGTIAWQRFLQGVVTQSVVSPTAAGPDFAVVRWLTASSSCIEGLSARDGSLSWVVWDESLSIDTISAAFYLPAENASAGGHVIVKAWNNTLIPRNPGDRYPILAAFWLDHVASTATLYRGKGNEMTRDLNDDDELCVAGPGVRSLPLAWSVDVRTVFGSAEERIEDAQARSKTVAAVTSSGLIMVDPATGEVVRVVRDASLGGWDYDEKIPPVVYPMRKDDEPGTPETVIVVRRIDPSVTAFALLQAFVPASSAPLWEWPPLLERHGKKIVQAMSASLGGAESERLYLGNEDGTVVAFNLMRDRSQPPVELWTAIVPRAKPPPADEIMYTYVAAASIAPSIVFATIPEENTVHALDAATGAVLWSYFQYAVTRFVAVPVPFLSPVDDYKLTGPGLSKRAPTYLAWVDRTLVRFDAVRIDSVTRPAFASGDTTTAVISLDPPNLALANNVTMMLQAPSAVAGDGSRVEFRLPRLRTRGAIDVPMSWTTVVGFAASTFASSIRASPSMAPEILGAVVKRVPAGGPKPGVLAAVVTARTAFQPIFPRMTWNGRGCGTWMVSPWDPVSLVSVYACKVPDEITDTRFTSSTTTTTTAGTTSRTTTTTTTTATVCISTSPWEMSCVDVPAGVDRALRRDNASSAPVATCPIWSSSEGMPNHPGRSAAPWAGMDAFALPAVVSSASVLWDVPANVAPGTAPATTYVAAAAHSSEPSVSSTDVVDGGDGHGFSARDHHRMAWPPMVGAVGNRSLESNQDAAGSMGGFTTTSKSRPWMAMGRHGRFYYSDHISNLFAQDVSQKQAPVVLYKCDLSGVMASPVVLGLGEAMGKTSPTTSCDDLFEIVVFPCGSTVIAVLGESGRVVWMAQVNTTIVGGVSLVRGAEMVVVPTEDGRIVHLSAVDGTLARSVTFFPEDVKPVSAFVPVPSIRAEDEAGDDPSRVDAVALTFLRGQCVYFGLSSSEPPSLVWGHVVQVTSCSTPGVHPNGSTIAFMDVANSFHSIDAATGATIGTVHLRGHFGLSQPVVDIDGRAHIASCPKKYHDVRSPGEFATVSSTGSEVLHRTPGRSNCYMAAASLPSLMFQQPNFVIYVAADGSSIEAVSVTGKGVLWTVSFPSNPNLPVQGDEFPSPISAPNGLIIAIAGNFRAIAINAPVADDITCLRLDTESAFVVDDPDGTGFPQPAVAAFPADLWSDAFSQTPGVRVMAVAASVVACEGPMCDGIAASLGQPIAFSITGDLAVWDRLSPVHFRHGHSFTIELKQFHIGAPDPALQVQTQSQRQPQQVQKSLFATQAAAPPAVGTDVLRFTVRVRECSEIDPRKVPTADMGACQCDPSLYFDAGGGACRRVPRALSFERTPSAVIGPSGGLLPIQPFLVIVDAAGQRINGSELFPAHAFVTASIDGTPQRGGVLPVRGSVPVSPGSTTELESIGVVGGEPGSTYSLAFRLDVYPADVSNGRSAISVSRSVAVRQQSCDESHPGTSPVPPAVPGPSAPWLCMCGHGTYGAGGMAPCSSCPAGSVPSDPGSSRCACQTGFRRSGDTGCEECGAGQTTAGLDGGNCVCQFGFFRDPVSLGCVQCQGGRNTSSLDASQCICPAGWITTASGDCAECDPSSSVVAVGETRCACKPGFAADPTDPNRIRCLPCPEGAYSGVDATACACRPGWFEHTAPDTPGSASSPSLSSCLPCPEGSNTTEPGQQRCNCAPGYFISAVGGTCAACEEGSVSVGIDAETCVCTANYEPSANGTCVPCEAGMSSPGNGNSCQSVCGATEYFSQVTGRCECERGSTRVPPDDQCQACQVGEFSPLDRVDQCRPCPASALCRGGAAFPVPAPGYWASPSFMDDPGSWAYASGGEWPFLPCRQRGGGCDVRRTTSDPNDWCAAGFTGPLCDACALGHGKFGSSCRECDRARDVSVMVVVLLAFIAIIIYIMATSARQRSLPQAVLRVCIGHVQTLYFVSTLSFNYPLPFVTMNAAAGSSVTAGTHLISTQCAIGADVASVSVAYAVLGLFFSAGISAALFAESRVRRRKWRMRWELLDRDRDENDENGEGGEDGENASISDDATSTKALEYCKVDEDAVELQDRSQPPALISKDSTGDLEVPLLLSPTTAGGEGGGDTSTMNITTARSRAGVALRMIAVAALFLHPTITSESMTVLEPCVDIDGHSLLAGDKSISCTSTRARIARAAAAITVALFSVGVPLLLFVPLFRQSCGSVPLGAMPLGSLARGFAPRFYFWELVLLSRKLAIVAVARFCPDDPDLQSFLAALALTIALMLHTACRPYPAVTRGDVISASGSGRNKSLVMLTRTLQLAGGPHVFELWSIVANLVTVLAGPFFTGGESPGSGRAKFFTVALFVIHIPVLVGMFIAILCAVIAKIGGGGKRK